MHIIDSVLEPLVPISLRDAEYFVKLDAKKLLTKSTLYDLGGHRTRAFYQQADENRSRSARRGFEVKCLSYRVILVVLQLGWADLNLRCSIIHPGSTYSR